MCCQGDDLFIALGWTLFVPNFSPGYDEGDVTIYGNSLYISLADDNTTIPAQSGSLWQATTAAALISGEILPVTGRWVKTTKTYADLSVASFTNNIELYSLPPKCFIGGAVIEPTTTFAGGFSNYQLSVGLSGNLQGITPLYSVNTSPAGQVFQVTNILDGYNLATPTSIRLAAVSSDTFLNTAISGQVNVYLYITNLNNV